MPFEAAARDEAYLAQVLHQQDAQSVIAFGRAYAPAAEQIDGERKTSPPAMSSTATTATCARPRSRSEAQTESICATAAGDRIPSGSET